MSRIGDAIRARRRASRMSGKRLAELALLSQPYVSDVERGNRIPPVGTLLRIANVWPDVDPAAWLWLIVRDSHGDELADSMVKHARTGASDVDSE